MNFQKFLPLLKFSHSNLDMIVTKSLFTSKLQFMSSQYFGGISRVVNLIPKTNKETNLKGFIKIL